MTGRAEKEEHNDRQNRTGDRTNRTDRQTGPAKWDKHNRTGTAGQAE